MEFRSQYPAIVWPPATFLFLAQYVNKLEKNYRSNPSLFYLNFSPEKIGIKPVRYGPPTAKTKPPSLSSGSSPEPPGRSCSLWTAKGFQSDHFPLNFYCRVAKLRSPDILKLISEKKVCPSCTHAHDQAFQCKLFFHYRTSKVCPKVCKHYGFSVHRRACM